MTHECRTGEKESRFYWETLLHSMKIAGELPDEKIGKGCDFAAELFDWINNMDPTKPLGRTMGELFTAVCSGMPSPGGQTFPP